MIKTGYSKNKNSQGYYTAWVWDAPGGERKYFRSKNKDEARLKAYEYAEKLGINTSLIAVTVEEYSANYLETHEKQYAKSTFRAYSSIHEHHIKGQPIGKRYMSDVKHSDIQAVIASTEGRNKTAQNIVGYLRTLYSTAKADGLIDHNPCDGRFKYKPELPYQYKLYDVEDLNRLINSYAPEDINLLPVLLASLCGMRLAEVMGLKGCNVDFQNGFISVIVSAVGMGAGADVKPPKSASSARKIPMPKMVEDSLRRFYREGFIFSNDNGETPWSGAYYSHRFHKHLKRNNLPMTRFHDLRHFAATTLMMEGLPDKAISTFLGHADTNITKRYQHILANAARRPADIFDNLMKQKV